MRYQLIGFMYKNQNMFYNLYVMQYMLYEA